MAAASNNAFLSQKDYFQSSALQSVILHFIPPRWGWGQCDSCLSYDAGKGIVGAGFSWPLWFHLMPSPFGQRQVHSHDFLFWLYKLFTDPLSLFLLLCFPQTCSISSCPHQDRSQPPQSLGKLCFSWKMWIAHLPEVLEMLDVGLHYRQSNKSCKHRKMPLFSSQISQNLSEIFSFPEQLSLPLNLSL